VGRHFLAEARRQSHGGIRPLTACETAKLIASDKATLNAGDKATLNAGADASSTASDNARVASPAIEILEVSAYDDPDVHAMLVELALDEQHHYDHPLETRAELEARLQPQPDFRGENHILVAREPDGRDAGVCWVVLFDPGTGLEGEIAELYVRPAARGKGVATSLAHAAMELFKSRHVTFASVWTRDDNPAALAAYRAAGFTPTRQTVLTWLPLEERGAR
jgi:ribosomal protein S18 acetylase RimI-like enzyme